MSDYWEELEKMEEERDAQEYAEAMAYRQGRAEAFREVDEKMADISAEKCEEYGVGCIEAYGDAFCELGDWLEEKLKEGAK